MPPSADESPPSRAPAGAIDGAALSRCFAAAAEALRRQADALNAINVFPVPDGDTGTNMSLTMRAAADSVALAGPSSAAKVAAAARAGSLMGARGNSGVILSQIIGAFVLPDGAASFDARALAAAVERGRAGAYHVISKPKEGTILTAITAAASAASAAAVGDGDATCDSVLAAAAAAAHEAVARTPELLPVLREAGVVDAGAQGLAIVLDAMLAAVRGEEIAASAADLGHVDQSWLSATRQMHGDGATSGFCTEFLVRGSALDPESIRTHLAAAGDSLLVVGGGDLVRVHIHTHEPQSALAYARTLGDVSHEKVDDMGAQFRSFAGDASARPATGLAVVAVAAGDGIERLLRSLGATEIVRGGQTMNPSAGEIRGAIERTGAREVIVLPNNSNIILAAEQAARAIADSTAEHEVRIIPTRSIPQAVAALVAMNAETPAADNAAAMAAAIDTVRSGEVTYAARATHLAGRAIAPGQPISLVDGELIGADDSVERAIRRCVQHMLDGRNGALITLYAGDGEDAASAGAIAATLRAEFDAEVEVAEGGQPHYPYLIGVE